MAKDNVLAPTRIDEQLKTNFFSSFIASANVPSIYIHQFWNTLTMDTKSGVYNFQLDELWFTLNVNLICGALGITPKDPAHPFVAPPTGDLNLKYYLKYLEMAARKPHQLMTVTDEEGGKKKAPPVGKSKQLTPAKQSKRVKEKTSKPTPSKKIRKDKVMKVRKGKRSEGKRKGIASDEQAAQSLLDLQKPKKKTNTDQYIFQRLAKTGPDTEKSNSEMNTEILYVEEEHVEEAGPNLEPMHEDFIVIVYPKVHESLKLITEEHFHIENPPSSSRTLSSMNNHDDSFTFGDQFLNDKSSEEEPGKANVEIKVESMVTVPIHQASSFIPPLSTPIIDLTPSKSVSPPIEEPIITATTETKTLSLLLPSPQQSTTDPELATRVSALEKICANFEKKNKLHDKTTQALSSKVYTLENPDLYSRIEKYINEVIKEAVHNALQALLHERFRDLFEFKMKEILHDQMFESGSCKSHPEHKALYDAFELSMDRGNMEEFKEATAKSRKRCRDDQDPPPPPPKDSGQSKKKRHDLDASASKQPLI
nr:hypothetical protein [Tanacetum cinerariifolium]